jgi:hypothetical protein
MKVMVITLLLAVSALGLSAQGGRHGGASETESAVPQVELRISNESAPPGGLVQMKFMLTEPTPITTGNVGSHTKLAVRGIEVFNTGGTASGAAVVNGEKIQVEYMTTVNLDPNAVDYPIMIVSLAVPSTFKIGDTATFALESSTNFLEPSLGITFVKPISPATITAAGSVSITDVIPGGGVVPAGSVVRVLGTGFGPNTRIILNEGEVTAVTVVSKTEIRLTLGAATQLTGKKLQVINPDGSQDTYFSYMRGVVVGQSARPLLGITIPMFSTQAYKQVVFNTFSAASTNRFNALAIQNPNPSPTDVTIELFTSAGSLLRATTIRVNPGNRIVREISELLNGTSPVSGSHVVVRSASSTQVLGLLCDDNTMSVVPVAPSASRP